MARCQLPFLSLLAVLLSGQPSAAMSLSAEQLTFRQLLVNAPLVVYGTLSPVHVESADEKVPAAAGTSIHILEVLNDHRTREGRSVLLASHAVPDAGTRPPVKYVLIIDFLGRKTDIHRAIEIKSARSLAYFKGLMALASTDNRAALRHCFRHLDDADPAVAGDAWREFSRAPYKDLRAAARGLPADRLVKWLQNPKTPRARWGVYALLLGHCGTEKHARLLRTVLDGFKKKRGFPPDGLLQGYILLNARQGWAYTRSLLKEAALNFQLRYAALKALQFFWEKRPDVVEKKDLINGLCLLLKKTDVAHLVIEDLRRWKAWDVAHRVLTLVKKEAHDLPQLRRALLRYALSCPRNNTAAQKFIAEERARDQEYVADVEDVLKLEKELKNRQPPRLLIS